MDELQKQTFRRSRSYSLLLTVPPSDKPQSVMVRVSALGAYYADLEVIGAPELKVEQPEKLEQRRLLAERILPMLRYLECLGDIW